MYFNTVVNFFCQIFYSDRVTIYIILFSSAENTTPNKTLQQRWREGFEGTRTLRQHNSTLLRHYRGDGRQYVRKTQTCSGLGI